MRNLEMVTERKIKMVIVDQGEVMVNIFKLLLDRAGVFDIKMEKDPSRVDDIACTFEPDFVVMGSMMQKNDATEMLSTKQSRRMPKTICGQSDFADLELDDCLH